MEADDVENDIKLWNEFLPGNKKTWTCYLLRRHNSKYK